MHSKKMHYDHPKFKLIKKISPIYFSSKNSKTINEKQKFRSLVN